MGKRGPDKQFEHAMTLRLPLELVEQIDKWAKGNARNRAEAIRMLLEKALEAE